MPSFSEVRNVPYSTEQMFALVTDIEKYPDFLPWCIGAVVNTRGDNMIKADLIIGFKMLQERFTSIVKLRPPYNIDVTFHEGPFQYLTNKWHFQPNERGCYLTVHVDFELKNSFYQMIMGHVFDKAATRMVNAFEQRCFCLSNSIS